MTTDWLEPAAGGKFCHLEPPKRNFPYKNTGFCEVFKGKNAEILKKLEAFKEPPLLQIRD